MKAGLEILNVGAGHRTVEFDPENEAERERIGAMITDMIKRGVSIFVEVGGSHVRVRRFLSQFHVYVIDEPEERAAREAADEARPRGTQAAALCHCGRPKRHRGAHFKAKVLAVQRTRAVAVARTAGG